MVYFRYYTIVDQQYTTPDINISAMLTSSHSVPFRITGVNSGFTEVSGLLHFDENSLKMEFESALVGILKSDVRVVTLSMDQIRKVTLKSSFLSGTKLVIQTRSMADAADVPGSRSGQVTLAIKRSDRTDAASLNSAFQLAFSEYRLGKMDEGE